MNVEILSHFGDDLMIANIARVSYDKESKQTGERDARLLKFLACLNGTRILLSLARKM